MQSEISSSGERAGDAPKICPPETKKRKKKTQDHTKRGNSNALVQGPITRVLTVLPLLDGVVDLVLCSRAVV